MFFVCISFQEEWYTAVQYYEIRNVWVWSISQYCKYYMPQTGLVCFWSTPCECDEKDVKFSFGSSRSYCTTCIFISGLWKSDPIQAKRSEDDDTLHLFNDTCFETQQNDSQLWAPQTPPPNKKNPIVSIKQQSNSIQTIAFSPHFDANHFLFKVPLHDHTWKYEREMYFPLSSSLSIR